MSGRDALANGAMNVSSGRSMLRAGLPTMAEVFAAGGYDRPVRQVAPWRRLPLPAPGSRLPRGAVLPFLAHRRPADAWDNDYFDDVYEQNGVRRKFEGYCTDVFFAEA